MDKNLIAIKILIAVFRAIEIECRGKKLTGKFIGNLFIIYLENQLMSNHKL